MTLPRKIEPGQFYLLSRRCTQQQFLLTPSDETNQAFLYCLALASEKYSVDILMAVAMSNHHHLDVFDRLGRVPEFMEYFHKLLARSQNTLLGRRENFWASVQPSVVRLVDAEDVVRKIVYAVINPLTSHLVEKVHHWPGVNMFAALVSGRTIEIARPRHFFRVGDRALPAKVTLRLTIPPELGEREAVLRDICERVESEERRLIEERHRTGKRVVGRAVIRRQSWRSTPETQAIRRGLKPTVAAINQWSRIEALQRNRQFIAEYRLARRLWRNGEPVAFPAGTYWLRRFAQVPIVAAPA